MQNLDELINSGQDARELKRALSVKMSQNQIPVNTICSTLNVSPAYVSKWGKAYQEGGVQQLLLGYRGSASYLTQTARKETLDWLATQTQISVEALRDYLETHHQVVYQSKQSYYDLLAAAGMSYHKSEKANPKKDQAQVLAKREEIKKNWSRMPNK
jgi:transposase